MSVLKNEKYVHIRGFGREWDLKKETKTKTVYVCVCV